MPLNTSEKNYMLRADGFDDCIIGICCRVGYEDIIAYDMTKVIQKLIDRDGMDEEEACEWFTYNILSAYHGDETPCFISVQDNDSIP